jgi:Fic family protein
MADLEQYINGESELDPLARCCIVHYQFEAIHPFADGNGRVGRALMALMIYRVFGHSMPWLYLSAFFEKHRDEYIDRLFAVSAKGDWTGWVEFCLRGVIAQARDSVSRCHRLNKLKSEYLERVDEHSARTCLIIESLFGWPMVTIPVVAEKFGVEYQTARSDILRLVDAQILYEVPNKRPRSFIAMEIYDIAYGDEDDEASSSGDGNQAEASIEGAATD